MAIRFYKSSGNRDRISCGRFLVLIAQKSAVFDGHMVASSVRVAARGATVPHWQLLKPTHARQRARSMLAAAAGARGPALETSSRVLSSPGHDARGEVAGCGAALREARGRAAAERDANVRRDDDTDLRRARTTESRGVPRGGPGAT